MSNHRYEILYRLKTVEDLPTLPTVISKLADLINDVNCSAIDIMNLLNSDSAIASRILKVVNSSLYQSRSGHVMSLQDAVVRLGFKEVNNIALSTAVMTMFPVRNKGLFNRREFWKHSLYTSLVAVELGKVVKNVSFKTDELHLTGLLHGIGKLIFDLYFPDLFQKSLTLASHAEYPLCRSEQMVMGIDHCELGYIVALNWKLPPVAVNVIRYYASPEECGCEFRDIARIINLADYIVSTQEFGLDPAVGFSALDSAVWTALGLESSQIEECVERVRVSATMLMSII